MATVNALIGESELGQAADLIASIDAVGADAIIVHDLATIRLARELGVTTPLHASTMMNVHHHEHALVLKRLGVSRVITSRDISLSQIGEIGRRADIEVECFVHGDMCVAHGGHCNTSGVLFGKSANRAASLATMGTKLMFSITQIAQQTSQIGAQMIAQPRATTAGIAKSGPAFAPVFAEDSVGAKTGVDLSAGIGFLVSICWAGQPVFFAT